MAETKIERKYLAHYLNATPSAETATFEKLGKDLEELNVELGAEVETKKNILGETSVNLKSYEATASVDPYYAEKGSKLFEFLQSIIDGRLVLDSAKTDYVEVHTWEEATSGKYTAYKESAIIEIKSYGGDYGGYVIPFDLHFCGDRVKGKFDPSTKAFTADAA